MNHNKAITPDDRKDETPELTWRQKLHRLLKLPAGRASTIASSNTHRDPSVRSSRSQSRERRGRSSSRLRGSRGEANQTERHTAGPLNSHPIMRLASPTQQRRETVPRNQISPSRNLPRHRDPSDSTDSNGATVHSDDYDLPLPYTHSGPSRAERSERRGSHSDGEDDYRYIPSVSSMLMDDFVSVNTVSSCTNPTLRHDTTPGRQTRHHPSRTVHGSQDSRKIVGAVQSREAARAGWEKR